MEVLGGKTFFFFLVMCSRSSHEFNSSVEKKKPPRTHANFSRSDKQCLTEPDNQIRRYCACIVINY